MLAEVFRGLANNLDGPPGRNVKEADYVTRRFNASSAGLKTPEGLDRWDNALRDLQILLEP